MSEKQVNLFFALFPDDKTAENLEALAKHLRDVHGLEGEPYAADRFHVSLYNLGRYERLPNEVVDSAGRAAAQLNVEPFRVTFDRALSFAGRPGHQPLVLLAGEGRDAIAGFHAELGHALKREGLGRFVSFDFTPHVTMLYANRPVEEHPVDAINWNVEKFALVLSHVGETRYDFLGEWRLGAND